MGKILMFGNQKGGVGKTQVSIMTATALSQKPFGLKTCVVDIDDQKSVVLSRSFDIRAHKVENPPYEVFNYTIADLQANIEQLDKNYQLIIIDAAGKLDNTQPIETQEVTKALMYVDCLFIPFVAGNYNLESTIGYFRFIKLVQKQRAIQPRKLRTVGFINQFRQRSRANSFLNQDIEILKKSENLDMMTNSLNDYASFRESDTISSLYDTQSSDSAKQNFSIWLNELVKFI
jgi:cellulose biosynthesis protein BcsQ